MSAEEINSREMDLGDERWVHLEGERLAEEINSREMDLGDERWVCVCVEGERLA